ncbi:MAG: MATE family efflux transporter [Mogibacterium sp.]|nr:MATE family efflux transporter [Mogibacterium sp.]
MTEGSILHKLIQFAVPMFLTSFFQQLYSTVDALIVGRLVGAAGLAAIGATMQVIIFTVSIGIGLMMGMGVVIGEHCGAGNFRMVRAVEVIAYASVLAIYLMKVIVAVFFAEDILTLMNTPPAVMREALAYLRIIFIGGLGTYCYSMVLYILRACGESVKPLYFIIFSSLTNVALDFVFVGGLGLGVAGAAIATVIAETLAMFLCFVYIKKAVPELWITREDFRSVTRGLTAYTMRLSIPASLQISLVTFCTIFVQAVINKYGVDTVAGYTAAQKIEQIVMMVLSALAGALGVFVAQNRGAERYDRIREGVKTSLTLGSLLMLAGTALMLLCGRTLLSYFVDSGSVQAVVAQGWIYIRITMWFYVGLCVWQMLASYLRGMADAVFPLIIGAVQIAANLGGIFLLEPYYGIRGIWYSVVISWLACMVIVLLRSRRYWSRGV